jgi:diaminopimelate epimerase
MSAFSFLKMQGIGNDFIVLDSMTQTQSSKVAQASAGGQFRGGLSPELASRLCDRRFGIGADQVLWLKDGDPAGTSDATLVILNADGTRAEMCGNGVRAVAVYLYRYGPDAGRKVYRLQTDAGIKILEVVGTEVEVDMGPPRLGELARTGELLSIGAQELKFHEVSMGNPHAVFFLAEGLADFPLEELGPRIENHSRFPKRTNVEFVEVVGPHEINVRVWERGAGITLACGTGACASAVASLLLGKVRSPVKVNLPGGSLTITWTPEVATCSVKMRGPAEPVYWGSWIDN